MVNTDTLLHRKLRTLIKMSKATHRHKTNMLYKFGQYAVKKM